MHLQNTDCLVWVLIDVHYLLSLSEVTVELYVCIVMLMRNRLGVTVATLFL